MPSRVDTHTHIPMREPKQFQKTRSAQPSAASTWFNDFQQFLKITFLMCNIKALDYKANLSLKIKFVCVAIHFLVMGPCLRHLLVT